MKAAEKNRTTLELVIHLFLLVSTAITAVSGVLYGASSSQDGDNMIGAGYFKAFTMDSNILAGICALFVVCFAIRSLLKKEDTMPFWAVLFQLMAAASLFLTFVTVVFFLAPTDVLDGKSYFGMFSKDLFLFHLTNPLLAILSFILLQDKYRLKRKDCLWGVIPMAIYSVVYFLMVVVFQKWSDFYGFTFGGIYALVPVVVIVMVLLTGLLAYLLIWLNGKVLDKRER